MYQRLSANIPPLKKRTSKLLGYMFRSGLKEFHENNCATYVDATIVEVHDYLSVLSQSEDIDLYWHFWKEK